MTHGKQSVHDVWLQALSAACQSAYIPFDVNGERETPPQDDSQHLNKAAALHHPLRDPLLILNG